MAFFEPHERGSLKGFDQDSIPQEQVLKAEHFIETVLRAGSHRFHSFVITSTMESS